MNDESFEKIELQVAGVSPTGAPQALRAAVLADVQRELRAAKWDRRLARAAVVLLVVGVGLNIAAGLDSKKFADVRTNIATETNPRRSLVDTAVVVAEATDVKTGKQFARQLAAMTGHQLTVDEAAAIDAAIQNSSLERPVEKRG